MRLAGGRRRKPQPSTPIVNWALALVRNQPETLALSDTGAVLAHGRSQPLTAVASGLWIAVAQGPLRIDLTESRWVTRGDRLTFDVPIPVTERGPNQ